MARGGGTKNDPSISYRGSSEKRQMSGLHWRDLYFDATIARHHAREKQAADRAIGQESGGEGEEQFRVQMCAAHAA